MIKVTLFKQKSHHQSDSSLQIIKILKGMGETFTKGEFRNHFKAEYSQPSPSHRIN